MNNLELCKSICKIHNNIIGVGIVENARLVSMYSKPGTPIPNEREFEKLFLQTEIIAGITETNIGLFGSPRYFSISFEYVDLYFFHLSRYSRSGILILQIVRPFIHEEIISKVDRYFADH